MGRVSISSSLFFILFVFWANPSVSTEQRKLQKNPRESRLHGEVSEANRCGDPPPWSLSRPQGLHRRGRRLHCLIAGIKK
ncbi:hypothetical protein RchiOBHm_Chr2g0122461 [Rosa chinensis]|uniref:Secreted protein n=1 Tax=Rosa chinensis TaxID=74649 RepID=A0A2P6RSU8_ROSCH|nr:hypothetical protein RchiOBHm_Chr2g0122461 [Rosa chinensis]